VLEARSQRKLGEPSARIDPGFCPLRLAQGVSPAAGDYPYHAVLEPVLDLHGLRVAEAIRRTSAFLMAEQRRGTTVVRIITGHGTGAVKQAVRELLAAHPAVLRTQPAPGTDAVVLVVLKPARAARATR
jgi:DNA-nicking Smr family endonuclease